MNTDHQNLNKFESEIIKLLRNDESVIGMTNGEIRKMISRNKDKNGIDIVTKKAVNSSLTSLFNKNMIQKKEDKENNIKYWKISFEDNHQNISPNF